MGKQRSALYSQYQTDPAAEVDGVWVRDLAPGVHVKVARHNNAKHKAVSVRLARPYRAQIDRETLSEEVAEDLVIRAMAEAIVIDWEGMTDEDGNILEPTVANKVKILTDLPDLRADIAQAARTQDLYRAESIEEALKNSKRSSAGDSGGATSATAGKGTTSAE